MNKIKIQKLPNGQLVLTLPKDLAEYLGWSKGTDVLFNLHNDDSILIKKFKKKKDKT